MFLPAIAHSTSSHGMFADASRGAQPGLRLSALSPDGANHYCVLQVSDDGVIRGCDPHAQRLFGYAPAALTGQHVDRLVCLRDDPPPSGHDGAGAPVHQLFESGNLPASGVRADGSRFPVELLCIVSDSDDVRGKLIVIRDMTGWMHSAPGTCVTAGPASDEGMPPSGIFLHRLQLALTRSRETGVRAILLFLDLNSFDDVVAAHGRELAAEWLEQAEQRVNQCLRKGDVAARLEEDEIAAIIHDANDQTAMRAVVERITRKLRQPFLIRGCPIEITGEIGVAFYSVNDRNPQALLRQMNHAMERALRGRHPENRLDAPSVSDAAAKAAA